MFSALKKWAKGNEDSKGNMPLGVKSMGKALQRKFARGIQYNMKIVIKGDRNTGKSCLFYRLQGKAFTEQYLPTSEIQVASIHWSYRAADDVVKVEVWDVVDRGKSKKKKDGLKMDNAEIEDEANKDETVLDAAFLDVYKGTHGVIMLFDITKPWTFQYVQRELPKVPAHIPVLLLANYRDMDEHRLIQTEEILAFIEHLERPDRSPPVRFGEASMKNGFGLKYIHRFLNLPYLLLQRETLLQQLQVNAMDTESTLEEMHIHQESEEQVYEKFVALLEKRQKAQEAAAQIATQDQPSQSPAAASPSPPEKSAGPSPPSTAAVASSSTRSAASLRERFTKKLFSSKDQDTNHVEEVIPRHSSGMGPSHVEDFVPEDQLDAQFLEDEGSSKAAAKANKKSRSHAPSSEQSEETDSDTNSRNPMVAGFAEDIASEDEGIQIGKPIQSASNHANNAPALNSKPNHTAAAIDLSSSEEEEEQQGEEAKEEIKLKEDGNKKSRPPDLQPVQDFDDFGFANDEVDSWLNSPVVKPPGSFSLSPTDQEYKVRKVDRDNDVKASPINFDDWDVFMKQQMQTATPTPTKSKDAAIHDEDSDEAGQESKDRKKKESKSGEKSRSKHKHRKHRDKEGEAEDVDGKNKERRRSKHKDGENEKERTRSKDDDDGADKKKHRHKHSKKKTSEADEGRVYEEL